MGSACQWNGNDGASVQVQIVPKDYWETPDLADGYRKLPGIGTAAYVVPQLGGWTAGALTDRAVVVSLSGGRATADAAVALPRTVISRTR